jgi:hypothetical protein
MLTQSTLSELTELAALQGYIGTKEEIDARVSQEGPGEFDSLVTLELERRRRMSREALERIWNEPLRVISFEPIDSTYEGEQVLIRKTAPQSEDERWENGL